MKFMRLAILLLASAPLLAATCVTSSRQNGDAGPWVGEVRNDDTGVVSDSLVRAEVVDANGLRFSVAAPTCPTRLAPGETGTFEIFSIPARDIVPPLHATFAAESTAVDLGGVRPDVRVEILETQPARRYVFVRLTNIAAVGYSGVSVCANLRSPSGKLLEVGNAYATPGSLRLGESTTAIIYFNSFPANANIELVPRADVGCCPPGIPQSDITIESTRLLTDHSGKRFMLVAASATNNSGVGLVGARLDAYVEGSAGDRTTNVTAGCNGMIAAGDRVPTSFLLPLPEGVSGNKAVIPEITGAALAPGTLFKLGTREITRRGNLVRGVVVNDAGEGIWLAGACFLLRDRNGTLVGSAGKRSEIPIAPGESVALEAVVPSTADATSADLIAYGDNLPRTPPAY